MNMATHSLTKIDDDYNRI